MTDKDSSAAGSKPMTPFVHTRPANNERSKEFERSLDKRKVNMTRCLADNKSLGDKNSISLAKDKCVLQRVMTTYSNDNECFIADNIAKDICFFVLSSEKQVSSSTSATNNPVNEEKKNQLHFYNLKRKDFYLRKTDLADSYLDEIVCLKNANKVAKDMLQRFNMPTYTILMLSKKPKAATADLHKDLLDTPFASHYTREYMDSDEELSREKAYWLPANEIASKLIFDDLDAEYERCVLDNKNLTIEKKNLLIKNDCLIAECLEKDICSIVLTSDMVVPIVRIASLRRSRFGIAIGNTLKF
ncbi:hypothetical protein Tco_0630840 [Tanacetum coccineum]